MVRLGFWVFGRKTTESSIFIISYQGCKLSLFLCSCLLLFSTLYVSILFIRFLKFLVQVKLASASGFLCLPLPVLLDALLGGDMIHTVLLVSVCSDVTLQRGLHWVLYKRNCRVLPSSCIHSLCFIISSVLIHDIDFFKKNYLLFFPSRIYTLKVGTLLSLFFCLSI